LKKLPVLSGEKLIKLLEKDGFSKVRQRGSHISLIKISPQKTFKIIIPNHPELAKGTLLSILRSAGITRERLDELLLEK